MKKERYELSEMELIRFTTEDAILTSVLDDDELPQNSLIHR